MDPMGTPWCWWLGEALLDQGSFMIPGTAFVGHIWDLGSHTYSCLVDSRSREAGNLVTEGASPKPASKVGRTTRMLDQLDTRRSESKSNRCFRHARGPLGAGVWWRVVGLAGMKRTGSQSGDRPLRPFFRHPKARCPDPEPPQHSSNDAYPDTRTAHSIIWKSVVIACYRCCCGIRLPPIIARC